MGVQQLGVVPSLYQASYSTLCSPADKGDEELGGVMLPSSSSLLCSGLHPPPIGRR